jgi:hypothetical protein
MLVAPASGKRNAARTRPDPFRETIELVEVMRRRDVTGAIGEGGPDQNDNYWSSMTCAMARVSECVIVKSEDFAPNCANLNAAPP